MNFPDIHGWHTFFTIGIRATEIHEWMDAPLGSIGPEHKKYRHKVSDIDEALKNGDKDIIKFVERYGERIVKQIVFLHSLADDKPFTQIEVEKMKRDYIVHTPCGTRDDGIIDKSFCLLDNIPIRYQKDEPDEKSGFIGKRKFNTQMIHHINGDHNDNRQENVMLVHQNCHSKETSSSQWGKEGSLFIGLLKKYNQVRRTKYKSILEVDKLDYMLFLENDLLNNEFRNLVRFDKRSVGSSLLLERKMSTSYLIDIAKSVASDYEENVKKYQDNGAIWRSRDIQVQAKIDFEKYIKKVIPLIYEKIIGEKDKA